MDKTYTFIAEYREGTYISQCISKDLQEAIRIWVLDKSKIFLDNTRYKKLTKIYQEEQPTKIEGVSNVWCCYYLLNRSSILLNIISN